MKLLEGIQCFGLIPSSKKGLSVIRIIYRLNIKSYLCMKQGDDAMHYDFLPFLFNSFWGDHRICDQHAELTWN